MAVTKQEMHIPVVGEWSVKHFSNIVDEVLSPEYNFMCDQKFVLRLYRSAGNNLYCFSIRLLQMITSRLSVKCAIGLVKSCGQTGFTVIKEIVFEKDVLTRTSMCIMTRSCIREYVREDTLPVRFSFSAEGYGPTLTDTFLFSSKSENAVEQATQTEECYSSKTTPINYLEKLSSDFETIYEEQADTDCILKASDGQYSAHRAILSARSKVFAAMFHHDTVERRTGEVNIEDVEAIILSNLIHYIYTGKVKGLTSDKVVRLYTAADKYALHELRDECSDFLACHLTIENICDAAILARSHAADALEKKVLYFIVNRFDEVTESEEWKDFLDANPIIASKYLTAAFKIK